jgi:hypothetical protein
VRKPHRVWINGLLLRLGIARNWRVCLSCYNAAQTNLNHQNEQRWKTSLSHRRLPFQKLRIGIRPVNSRVAQNAGRELRRLIMEGRHGHRYGGGQDRRVAFEADLVHLWTAQQVWVGRAVRIMTSRASLFFDRRMLEDKWSGRIHVALRANQSLPGSGSQIVRRERPMRIMAIRTGHESFVDAVVLGLRKIYFDVAMAPIAQ